MNTKLAERLLQKSMKWPTQTVNRNISELLYMAHVKYDSYDGFMPGTRFLGSLSIWLDLFNQDERETMLEFIRKNLVFISSNQMTYLIRLLYSTKIKKNLLNSISGMKQIPSYCITRASNDLAFKAVKRKSLFVGLSDGAHMDVIRREHGLNNEQVLNMYYPSKRRLQEMLKDLREDKTVNDDNAKFDTIFLIDDFTASGKSFIRKNTNKDGTIEYKGKLSKIFDSIFSKPGDENHENSLRQICADNVKVYIYFCVATAEACQYINDELNDFFKAKGINENCLQVLDMVMKVKGVDFSAEENQKYVDILKKADYLNEQNVVTDPFKNGDYSEPWKGFNGCGLAIVLSHNTPNNSIAVLWQDEKQVTPSLFPRISRH